MSSRKLNIAVVGMGKMGLLHTSLLKVIPNVQVVGLCEQSTIMNKLLKRVFSTSGLRIVNKIDLLRNLNLDAIYITTPIFSHSPIIKDVLSNGIAQNIFVEKTLSANFEQSKELCAVAKRFGSITMVGYMKRFSVIFNKAKELLRSGELGDPQQFQAYAFSSDFLGLSKESRSSSSRGGALSDLGCHVIDLSLWLFGQLQVCDVLSVERNGSMARSTVEAAIERGAYLFDHDFS